MTSKVMVLETRRAAGPRRGGIPHDQRVAAGWQHAVADRRPELPAPATRPCGIRRMLVGVLAPPTFDPAELIEDFEYPICRFCMGIGHVRENGIHLVRCNYCEGEGRAPAPD
jgi:hypothetical protein